MAQAIPKGYRTVTPSFTFRDSRKAIEVRKGAEAFFAQMTKK
jgi:hypothetical protein